jgi:hypothetical protein
LVFRVPDSNRLVVGETVEVGCCIDCDTDPFVPQGREVRRHRKNGVLSWNQLWNPDKIQLFISPEQAVGGIKGRDLFADYLQLKHLLNANVLDFLLAHAGLIPVSWKGNCVFFWGTLYNDFSQGQVYVRYLECGRTAIGQGESWIGNTWLGSHPAAVLIG